EGDLRDVGVGMLTHLDVNALRRAGGGAQEAGRAAHGAIRLERQPVGATVALRVDLALLGVLDGDHRGAELREAEEVQRMERHVAYEVPRRDGDTANDLGKIESLRERERRLLHLHGPATLAPPASRCHPRRGEGQCAPRSPPPPRSIRSSPRPNSTPSTRPRPRPPTAPRPRT